QDHLDMVAEYFCESKRKTSLQTQQVRDRIKGHALLVASSDINAAVEFDHDEFRQFFLGNGLAHITSPSNSSATSETLNILRRGILPEHAQLTFTRAVKTSNTSNTNNVLNIIEMLASVSKLDGQASYTRENCGNLIARLASE